MLKNLRLFSSINSRYLAIAGSVILLLICYFLAFQKTIAAFSANTALNARLTSASDLSYQPGYLKRKNHNLDVILDLYHLDSLTFRGSTLATISLQARKENVNLSEIPTENSAYHTRQFILESIKFEGDYTPLIKTLHQMESSKNCGVIRSLTIHTNRHGNDATQNKTNMDLLIEISK